MTLIDSEKEKEKKMCFSASCSCRPKPLAVVTRTVLTILIAGDATDDGTGKSNLRKNYHPCIRLSHIQAQNG